MDRPPAKAFTVSFHPRAGEPALARRLSREIEGEVLFDAASRGRYSTDASIYQIDPVGVVVPRTERDVQIALQIAVEEGIPVLPRGAGSSQCGQAVGEALLIDHTKYLNQILEVDGQRAVGFAQWQPRFAGREPQVLLRRIPRHRRSRPVAAQRLRPVGDCFGVLQPLERDVHLGQPELLPLIDDDRSAQRTQQQHLGAYAGIAVLAIAPT